MTKHIRSVNIEALTQHLTQQGMDPNRPLLLAMDCDRTIVDRKKGSHNISSEVISMFHCLRDSREIMVAINTGRDLTSYQPLKTQLLHYEPCVFLSGRVLSYCGQNITLPNAALPEAFCSAVWKNFINGAIPFLDVKHAMGNTFFTLKGRNLRKYYGLYKPVDWFDGIIPYENVVLDDEDAHGLLSLNCVRMELPFFKKEHRHLAKAIEIRDKLLIQECIKDFLEFQAIDNLLFTPLSIHISHKRVFSDIMYLRVMINTAYSNKGLGIKYLGELLLIPQGNIICFGDSSGDTASDIAVKKAMPTSTLLITENGDKLAISHADFLIESVEQNGVPKAVSLVVQAYASYK